MARRSRKAKVLTVSGGKGGTGKTFVAVNMAVSMAQRLSGGRRRSGGANRMLLFDADYHLSNAHLLLGEKLSPCLDRFLEDPSSLPNYIMPTQYGIDLISFGGDEKNVNNIETKVNDEILNELNILESHYDWIIVDTGAGLNSVILRQIMFADHTLLVVNPVATSIIDAYKVIKYMTMENKKRPIDVCVNMAKDYDDGYNSFERLDKTIKQFGIGVKIYLAGVLYNDPSLFHRALRAGTPAVELNAPNHISEAVNACWDQILKRPAMKDVESFFEKIFMQA